MVENLAVVGILKSLVLLVVLLHDVASLKNGEGFHLDSHQVVVVVSFLVVCLDDVINCILEVFSRSGSADLEPPLVACGCFQTIEYEFLRLFLGPDATKWSDTEQVEHELLALSL